MRLFMKVYICGPMSGIDHLNFPAFFETARLLRGAGYDVVNPAEIEQVNAENWGACMRADIAELVKCDAVALLPGWINSRGAKIEADLMDNIGGGVYTAGMLLYAAENGERTIEWLDNFLLGKVR